MNKLKFLTALFFLMLFLNQGLMMLVFHQTFMPKSAHGVTLSGDFPHDIAAMVTPQTLPFYGKDLALDFGSIHNINTSIRKMATLAPMQGNNPIDLNDAQLKRYIKIGTEPTVTCQYCCGVMTLVREDGTPTCGCAHSIAMRGTSAFLIKYYPNLTDEEISYELMRQKGLYFPGTMQKKMAEQLAAGPENFTPDIKYLTMKFTEKEITNLQKKALKQGFTPDTESLQMIGGC